MCFQSRNAFPAKEILNLTDYRQRYNQYSTRLPHTLHLCSSSVATGRPVHNVRRTCTLGNQQIRPIHSINSI
jgi:hypothetical protein